MTDITPDTFPNAKALKPHPLIANLPAHLKDPKNYMKIRKALLDTLASTHSHGEMSEWASCVQCQKQMRDHAEMIRKLGFSSPSQYKAWMKTHEMVEQFREKFPHLMPK